VVIDTNILIDVLRRRHEAVSLLENLDERGEEIWAPAVARVEILGSMRRGEEAATVSLLDLVNWLAVGVEIADAAAAYARRYRPAHSGIDLVDYLYAATADHLNAPLMTLNVRHFPMFPDLEPAY
jgi:predicted nucleic acid-binding protein